MRVCHLKYFLLAALAALLIYVALKFDKIPRTISTTKTKSDQCALTEDDKRLECFPDVSASEAACVARGCCWREPRTGSANGRFKIGLPRCYFPVRFASYQFTGIQETAYGYTATMMFNGNATGFHRERVVSHLSLNVYHYANFGTVRVKISALEESRYEVPLGYPVHINDRPKRSASAFITRIDSNGLTISDSEGRILFDTNLHAPIIFADQFLQVSTLVNATTVYGFGEVQDQFAKPTNSWRQYSLFAHDAKPSLPGANLYGVHPFGLLNRQDSSSYGLFLANSNAMDIELTPYPALTYRTIGGILDFYLYAGPTAADVVKQHLAVIGRPSMPPYWALGFHLSRNGYKKEENLQKVIDRNIEMAIPYDVQWLDTDTFQDGLVWTYDPVNFAHLPDIVTKLRSKSMRVVVNVNPTVKFDKKRPSLSVRRGMNSSVFMKDGSGGLMLGQVWAGKSVAVYADFTSPAVSKWREVDARQYRSKVAWDGLWIDMNEPSNSAVASIESCPLNRFDYPKFVPAINERNLVYKTICMSAVHKTFTHYNLHNLYGHFDSKATNEMIQQILPSLRPFVISRSTFAGTGRYAAHWTGDISSNWRQMEYSIIDLMNFNLFGIPFVGADVCGFLNNANEELCIRWMQLGSFYPFMRNHNALNSTDQDPAVWSDTAKAIMKAAVINRYELLPYMYTLLYRASIYGETVFRPLFFEYPTDAETHTIHRQFMLGPSVLVSPVLEAGVSSMNTYFPTGRWYDNEGMLVVATEAGKYETIKATLEKIPFYYRGGSIIPFQFAATNTELARQNSFYLIVALKEDQQAAGQVFIDDGITLDTVLKEDFTLVSFTAVGNMVKSSISKTGYIPLKYSTTISEIRIFGVSTQTVKVTLNKRVVDKKFISFNASSQNLIIKMQKISMLEAFVMEW